MQRPCDRHAAPVGCFMLLHHLGAMESCRPTTFARPPLRGLHLPESWQMCLLESPKVAVTAASISMVQCTCMQIPESISTRPNAFCMQYFRTVYGTCIACTKPTHMPFPVSVRCRPPTTFNTLGNAFIPTHKSNNRPRWVGGWSVGCRVERDSLTMVAHLPPGSVPQTSSC